MLKRLFAFFALVFCPVSAWAGFFSTTNCDNIPAIQRVAYDTFCLQSTTADGRSAGTQWVWNGATWQAAAAGSAPGGPTGSVQYGEGGTFSGETGFSYNSSTDLLTVPSLNVTGVFTVGGVSGAPATAVQTVAGTIGTTTGAIGVNTSQNRAEIAINSLNKVIALTDGNIATATALAADPAGCTISSTVLEVAYQSNAAGVLSCVILITKRTADPTADDDSGDGYVVGTVWIRTDGTANARVWTLIDATVAGAVWDLGGGGTTAAQGLQANFAIDPSITGAVSLATAQRTGGPTNQVCTYEDPTYGPTIKACTDGDRKTTIATDFTWTLWDEENNAAVITADPDATSTGVGTVTMGTGQKLVGSARGINVGAVAGDPSSPSNGDVWYDSTANKFNCRENGSTVDCIGGGGATISTLSTFRPAQAEFPTSNAATLDTRNTRPVLDFDASTDESVYFSDVMNRGYSGGGVTVDLHTVMTSATSGNVIMCAAFERIGTALDIDGNSFAAAGCSAATAVSGTSGIVTVISIVFADNAAIDAIAVGEGFRMQVYRDADAGGDTATGDLELLFAVVRQ